MLTLINKLKQIIIKDEGSNLTTDVSSINFTGAGVTATTVGNDVTVNIPGGGGGGGSTIETVQLYGANPLATSGTNGNLAVTLATFPNQVALALTQSGGSAATSNYWYQFNMPNNFASGGQLKVTTRRNFSTGSCVATVYIDGVASNINNSNCFPVVINTWETFTINLTSAVVAGASNITVVITPIVQIAGGSFYLRDLQFNYST